MSIAGTAVCALINVGAGWGQEAGTAVATSTTATAATAAAAAAAAGGFYPSLGCHAWVSVGIAVVGLAEQNMFNPVLPFVVR